MRQRGSLIGLGAALSFLMACGGGHGEARSAEDLAQFEGPIADAADAMAGEASFNKLCNGCHPGGGKGIGPELNGQAHATAEVRMTVRKGEDKMPPFGDDKLSAPDLENILAFLVQKGAVAP